MGYIILTIIFYIVIILIIKKAMGKLGKMTIKTNNTEIKENTTTAPPQKNYNIYYKPKKYVISLTEKNFYTILLEIAKELDLILLTQVSLYNIIIPRETKYKNVAFNKIRSKSIDFVLVSKKDCRIRLCIELDDYTHNRKDRIERDTFINELFKSLNINLIRIKTSNYYNKEVIKQKIEENIKENYYTN